VRVFISANETSPCNSAEPLFFQVIFMLGRYADHLTKGPSRGHNPKEVYAYQVQERLFAAQVLALARFSFSRKEERGRQRRGKDRW
jgi:hypothetical protein